MLAEINWLMVYYGVGMFVVATVVCAFDIISYAEKRGIVCPAESAGFFLFVVIVLGAMVWPLVVCGIAYDVITGRYRDYPKWDRRDSDIDPRVSEAKKMAYARDLAVLQYGVIVVLTLSLAYLAFFTAREYDRVKCLSGEYNTVPYWLTVVGESCKA